MYSLQLESIYCNWRICYKGWDVNYFPQVDAVGISSYLKNKIPHNAVTNAESRQVRTNEIGIRQLSKCHLLETFIVMELIKGRLLIENIICHISES